MKIRNGFVSNSSSSSFIVAIPKNYQLSEEEMIQIRDKIEEYDCYFSYYEELAKETVGTETLDEREKIQIMLDSNNFSEIEETEPVTDKIKNEDIKKGLEFLKKEGVLFGNETNWLSSEIAVMVAASSIVNIIEDKIKIKTILTPPENGNDTINILAKQQASPGLKMIKEHFKNENS